MKVSVYFAIVVELIWDKLDGVDNDVVKLQLMGETLCFVSRKASPGGATRLVDLWRITGSDHLPYSVFLNNKARDSVPHASLWVCQQMIKQAEEKVEELCRQGGKKHQTAGDKGKEDHPTIIH